jgi:hypothetical protein
MCLYMGPLIVAKHRSAEKVTAAKNIQATIENEEECCLLGCDAVRQ